LSCHDAGQEHIDHKHRTYVAGVTPYGDSYRLKMSSDKPSNAFCFVCHNSTEVLGAGTLDVSHTNFWNNDGLIENSHALHTGFTGSSFDNDGLIENSHALHTGFTGSSFDSDFDGTFDSPIRCNACHTVHGSPPPAMIRHGELIRAVRVAG
jgi:hypothetical protein